MKGKEHVFINLLPVVSCLYFLKIWPRTATVIFIVGAVLGSLLPDCDTYFSPIGKIIPMWLIFKHRGQIHSYLTAFIVSLFFAVLNIFLGLGVLYGFLFHLLFDSFTPMGLPYLKWYPSKYKARKKS